MNKQVNLILILLISFFSYAQNTDGYTILFQDEEPLKIKLKYSNKEMNKKTNDSTFIETQLSYEQDGVWKDIDVRLRARGNFRRNTCYWPPVRVKIKKSAAKETIFEGNKSLKLVLPCMMEPDRNDNIMKEYMAYKLYEQISPYHFNARRVDIDFTEIKGRKEKRLVSLVDMLPTFVDLGSEDDKINPVDKIDGKSLAPMLYGEKISDPDEVMIEFTAEGTYAPALILRKGDWKYIYCETDPGMMFNLRTDPNETQNLCENPEFKGRAEEMVSDILSRWNPKEMKKDIIASQQRRHFVQRVLMKGTSRAWDFQPHFNASSQYLRTGNSPTAVKGKARFPLVPEKDKDYPRN